MALGGDAEASPCLLHQAGPTHTQALPFPFPPGAALLRPCLVSGSPFLLPNRTYIIVFLSLLRPQCPVGDWTFLKGSGHVSFVVSPPVY